MPNKPNWQILAEKIIDDHDGRILYNFRDVQKITGYSINTIAGRLYRAGISVQKDGHSKRVNAYDLAEFILKGRVSAID